jgi:hypothetical protein
MVLFAIYGLINGKRLILKYSKKEINYLNSQ